MHYVYVIRKKQKYGNFYIGCTSNLIRRLREHSATRKDLIYYEAYKSKEDAVGREKQLKKYKSAWGQLKKRTTKSRI